ncbi:MAG: S-methyl-5-thioribose-1-phosphate isomerase [Gemmatimonadetes bacterium]|nr:S-methyl-5-thioribose-1-phosphate isomerase [Gemmatimonadota bacterium]
MSLPEAVRWSADGRAVVILDQSRLPEEERYVSLSTAEAVAEAIASMRVRGAPAIGIAAALGLALELSRSTALAPEAFWQRLDHATLRLRGTRPTAVNLTWALERLRGVAEQNRARTNGEVACAVYGEATAILEEDRAMCRRIGEHGLSLFPEGELRVLTHCNAGALATGGMGTALAPVYLAHAAGRSVHVYVGETRPLLQGSRITAWELQRAGIPVTLIADSVAGFVMQARKVDAVMVGADRIAANGDVANKIGTYTLAVLARHHGLPFYVAAPTSTIDPGMPSGREIPIEERSADEVRRGFGRLTAPESVPVYAPAFDVTPAQLVTAIITDRCVLQPPYAKTLRAVGEVGRELVPAGGVRESGSGSGSGSGAGA